MNRWAGVALALLPVLGGGCFFPSFGGAFGENEMPFPTVLATYTTGSARLQIARATAEGGSEEVILDRLGRGSTLNTFTGAAVSWRNDAGWLLQVTVYDFDSFLAPRASGSPDNESYSGDITVQRITDNEFWTARGVGPFGNRCIVDIEESSETLVRGSATCRGLRWQDGTAPEPFGDPVYIEGQEPFDAEITFEATP